ncbi:MAG: BRCT domain-containing protein, partial [bacterium]
EETALKLAGHFGSLEELIRVAGSEDDRDGIEGKEGRKKLEIGNWKLEINKKGERESEEEGSRLYEVEDIGEVVAKSIVDYFTDKKNLDFIKKLLDTGVKIEKPASKKIGGALTGKKIVVTGSLESMGREEAKARIREAGGNWVSSISKNTDYVVAGSEYGSKYKKAKELGIKIIYEKEFLELLK